MAMAGADGSYSRANSRPKVGLLRLRVGGYPALSLRPSNEPRELMQSLYDKENAMNTIRPHRQCAVLFLRACTDIPWSVRLCTV